MIKLFLILITLIFITILCYDIFLVLFNNKLEHPKQSIIFYKKLTEEDVKFHNTKKK